VRDYDKRDPSSHRTLAQIHQMDKGYNVQHQDAIVERHLARRTLMREGKVHKGDHRDVDHKHMLKDGGSNSPKNWRVISEHKNRGWNKK
jgi:hypothetical protein